MKNGAKNGRLKTWKKRLISYLANLLWKAFLPFLPWFFSEAHFEGLYRKKEDPWNYTQSPYEQEKYEKTLQAIPKDVHSILEVGTSEGVFTERLLRAGKRVFGIDISQTALERAKKRLAPYGSQVTLQKLDIVRDEPEGAFDLILASEVLYYLGGGTSSFPSKRSSSTTSAMGDTSSLSISTPRGNASMTSSLSGGGSQRSLRKLSTTLSGTTSSPSSRNVLRVLETARNVLV